MRPHNDTTFIHALIAEGEHQRQDFKFEITDARKIAKTLSAFANTDGGRLLIGVKDNGKIAGTQTEEEAYMIEAAADLYCQPQVNYHLQSYQVEGHNVLIADIEESQQKPIYAQNEEGKWRAYLRIDDENILATPVHLKIWQQAGSVQNELLEYTDRERTLLEQLSQDTPISLNRCCRMTHLPRYIAIYTLAKLIRYDIVETVFENHKFYFKLKT